MAGTWLRDELAVAGPCPACGADQARVVLYGYPDLSVLEQGQDRVEIAGCLLPPDPARFACGACGARWGRVEREPEEPGSPFDVLLG